MVERIRRMVRHIAVAGETGLDDLAEEQTKSLPVAGCGLSARIGLECPECRVPAGFRAHSRARWQTLPVPYRIHAGGLPGLGNGSEFIAVQRAFDAWQNLPSSAIAFRYEGTSPVQNGGNDGVNVISFQDTSFSFGTGTIAVTLSSSSQGFFRDADILFNPSNPNITFATDGRSDGFDIQAIATHEIGHFLGLDHTAIVSATMNPTGARGTVFPRALKSDDIIGAATLYPETAFFSATGGLRGRITNAGATVFGAHVVVLDAGGNAVVSTLTELDGTYQISGLAPDSYSLYAEPLDGPVMEDSIGGQYDSRVNVNFTTTFLGGTLNPQQRQSVQVTAGSTLQEVNIAVSPAPSAALNLTSPSLGQRVGQGTSVAFNVRGDGVVDGVTFQIPGSGSQLGGPDLQRRQHGKAHGNSGFCGVHWSEADLRAASGCNLGAHWRPDCHGPAAHVVFHTACNRDELRRDPGHSDRNKLWFRHRGLPCRSAAD